MSVIKRLVLASTVLPLSFALNANAADVNTYRAGNAYLKSAAQAPEQCAVQCRGDAQCRSWNFVVPNPRAKSGICEFNAHAAQPKFSPISISGMADVQMDPALSGAVNGGTNTIRVGSPQSTITTPVRSQQSQSRRVINREAVPANQRRTIVASAQRPNDVYTPRVYGGPTTQQSRQLVTPRPQVPHAQVPRPPFPPTNEQVQTQARPPQLVGAAPSQRRTQQSRQAVTPRAQAPRPSFPPTNAQARQFAPAAPLTREQAFYRQQYLAAQQRRGQDLQRQAQLPAAYQHAPAPQMQEAAPTAPYPNASYGAPIPAQTQAAYQPSPPLPVVSGVTIPTPAAPMTRTHVAQTQMRQGPSLFGTLHDDLTKMTPVARPQTAPDQPGNPDAPMSTVYSAPTTPVRTEPIKSPVMPGLIGG